MWLLIQPDELTGDGLEIRGGRYHHLVRVCRARVGEALRAALPDGRVVRTEVTEITADALHARITAEEPAAAQPPCRVVLYQAVLKGEKMDVVVQKACELGAWALVPLLARRSVPRWTPAQAQERAARWQRIADAAAQQCERLSPLQVAPPQAPAEVCATLPPLSLLLHERDGDSLRALAVRHPHPADLGLFLGPEGGWDDDEVTTLRAAGVQPIHLGQRILRAETAALAALALAQYVWGDLG